MPALPEPCTADFTVLQVSTADHLGGAERVAWNLFKEYRVRGLDSYLAVGRRRDADPDVLLIPNWESRGKWEQNWLRLQRWAVDRGIRILPRLAVSLANPGVAMAAMRGRELFHYPGTRHLLDLAPGHPDVVHCHNLHGAYFDLRYLPKLSHQIPTLLTLHDAWLLGGGCVHSFDCDRWRTGCGRCPQVSSPSRLRPDGTAHNWRRKADYYAQSRLFVSTPCRWLLRKVEQSELAPAVVEGRVIPNGVDLTCFCPHDRRAAREELDLPADAVLLLFVANGIRNGIFKDYATLREVVARLAAHEVGRHLIFLALGDDAPSERIGSAVIRFIPFQKDPKRVALYYQAADCYVHAARADTFPNTILEALACGLPVVASAVCGIPEQVRALAHPTTVSDAIVEGPDSATGLLVPPGHPEAMTQAIEDLLTNPDLHRRLSVNAAADARRRFDIRDQVDRYLNYYGAMLDRKVPMSPVIPSSMVEDAIRGGV